MKQQHKGVRRQTRATSIVTLAILSLGLVGLAGNCKQESRLARLQAKAGKKGDRARAKELEKIAFNIHTKDKDYPRAMAAWEEVAVADPSWWKPYYQLGCLAALTGKPSEAVAYLKLALQIDKSPRMRRWMQGDSDLKSLRGNADFQALLRGNPAAPRGLSGKWNEEMTGCFQTGLDGGRFSHGCLKQRWRGSYRFEGKVLMLQPQEVASYDGESGTYAETWNAVGIEDRKPIRFQITTQSRAQFCVKKLAGPSTVYKGAAELCFSRPNQP